MTHTETLARKLLADLDDTLMGRGAVRARVMEIVNACVEERPLFIRTKDCNGDPITVGPLASRGAGLGDFTRAPSVFDGGLPLVAPVLIPEPDKGVPPPLTPAPANVVTQVSGMTF